MGILTGDAVCCWYFRMQHVRIKVPKSSMAAIRFFGSPFLKAHGNYVSVISKWNQ